MRRGSDREAVRLSEADRLNANWSRVLTRSADRSRSMTCDREAVRLSEADRQNANWHRVLTRVHLTNT